MSPKPNIAMFSAKNPRSIKSWGNTSLIGASKDLATVTIWKKIGKYLFIFVDKQGYRNKYNLINRPAITKGYKTACSYPKTKNLTVKVHIF